jgi:hypothetical protein
MLNIKQVIQIYVKSYVQTFKKYPKRYNHASWGKQMSDIICANEILAKKESLEEIQILPFPRVRFPGLGD